MKNKILDIDSLTEREKQVFTLMINGYLTKQIAYELGIQENSVKTYITRIFKKLNVKHKAEAISLYYTNFINKVAANAFINPVEAASQFLGSLDQ